MKILYIEIIQIYRCSHCRGVLRDALQLSIQCFARMMSRASHGGQPINKRDFYVYKIEYKKHV